MDGSPSCTALKDLDRDQSYFLFTTTPKTSLDVLAISA